MGHMRWQNTLANAIDFERRHQQGFFDTNHFLNPPEEESSSEDDEEPYLRGGHLLMGAQDRHRYEAPKSINE